MSPLQRKRLVLVLLLLSGVAVAVALVLFALNQNMNAFYSTTQIALGQAPIGKTIRVGGLVESGSVQRASDSLKVHFKLTDTQHSLKVQYEGILPDLFREGQGIVARGRLQADGTVVAEEVLAKHDENYVPPEVADSLKKAGVWQHMQDGAPPPAKQN